MADDFSKEDLKKEVAAFLKGQDLKKMTAKKVRQRIEEKLDCDLTSRKKELDDIVMDYMKNVDKSTKNGNKEDDNDDDDEEDDEEEEKDGDDDEDNAKDEANDDDAEEEDDDDDEEEKKAPKKGAPKKAAAKRKASSDETDEESDAHEKGSDEEYSPNKKAKSGGGARGRTPKGKKKKAGSDVSDSDEDWKGNSKKGAKKTAKKGGGRKSAFSKTCKLSPELAAVVGADVMARPEVVKKVWAIIKEQNLYDPKNKQYAICNDELMKVIGTKRFRTFGMMKYLKKHITN